MYVSKVYQYPVDAYGDVRTLVRGITFQCPDDWEGILDSLDEDSNLYLIKEPDNPKDKLAIAAYLDDRRVGYVAASDNGKIWLYMTDEKMPCQFIERFEASFKIAFENPRNEFESIPFKDIYKDKDGVTEKAYPTFEIPFLTNPKDKDYDWFDDQTYIMDLERFIPDFRRKLASRMIVLVGRKNSKGEYCYYLPYANNDLSEIKDDVIKGLVDKYGFVIALPDVPAKTEQGGIIMDLHVTYMKNTDYKNFDSAHRSELVFSLTNDYDANAQKVTGDQTVADGNSMRDKLFSINEFFPLFGITLGKTTWMQAEKMGYKVKDNNSNGSGKNMYVNDLRFDDCDGKGMFTMVTWSIYDCDFPDLWKSKGFSWDLSYDEWIDLFSRLGFNIEVKKQPCREEYKGIESLDAEFEATSSDGLLGFDMFFCYGENGYYTSSPRTLNTIYVNYNGSDLISTNPTSTDAIEKTTEKVDNGEEYCSVTDSPEGGKHVSMGVIVPEEGDENFDFCSYECSISDKKQIDIITNYMKRYEDGKETKPFLMIGRPCFGLDNIDIFYSMDGEIIFNFIFDEKIKSWIREAGFVLGKVKEYHYFNLTSSLNLTLSVSKRKDGEALFKQASEEAMDYIEEYTSSQADHSVEKRIIDAVNNYISGDSATPYKVIIVPEYGIGTCTTLDGEDVAMIVDGEIIDLAKKNKGVFGYITNYEYDDDGDAWFTIRVSRSIPRLTIEQDSKVSITPTKFNTNLSTAFDDFFPIGGITLGETTWEQAEKLGHEVKVWKEGPCRITHIGDCSFYDFEGIGVFTTLFCHNDFYPSWKSKGFSWDLSYDEWMSVFKKLGYKITVTQQPVKKEFSGHDTLSAEFEAVSPDETLLFRLSFDYGNSGCLTSSPRTLYTVCVKSKKR